MNSKYFLFFTDVGTVQGLNLYDLQLPVLVTVDMWATDFMTLGFDRENYFFWSESINVVQIFSKLS